ncbi:hypothetical protein AWM70_22315 [Paenibacillus yonginensis]|uniref:SLH domain-containing protein n=1 Tax=Paenibacillus yonginensis TaxID=1462996 RepID=A0A1B1N6B7_9BACL|nr:S-layer homology domain-containing protein [Paenibacillus yonginensis]ANS76981.1 hypothetical protein AWM70_22315 [Paenibacillus yonginensis]
MKKEIVALSMSMLLLAAPLTVAANETRFNDVPATHWSYSAIQWGVDNGIITGYPNGSYKPDQNVTQSEFLAMLLKAYKADLAAPTQGESWDAPYLSYARLNNWTLVSETNKPVNRGQIAKLLVNASGKNFNVNDSIHYLLDEGLSNGKTDRSIIGYKGNDLLSRAEAIAFILNVRKKLAVLDSAPTTESKYENPNSDIKVEEDSTVWEPLKYKGIDQKKYAQLIFQDFTWDYSTRTLKFNIPEMPEVNPLIGIQYGTTKEKIVLGKDYTFKNLPSEFKIDINIFTDNTFTSVIDDYTVMSFDYANYHKWANGVPSTDLVVKDQFANNVSLSAIFKALGIK